MKTTPLAIALWVAALGLAVLAGYFWGFDRAQTDTNEPSSTTTPEAVYEQTVAIPEITFGYPPNFGLAVTQEQVLADSYIPSCDPAFDYCLYYQGDAYAGTNFDSAGVSVTRRADLSGESACLATPPAGYDALEPVIHEAQGYATSAFAPLRNAGAGHYASSAVYRLFSDGTCFSFETRIGASQYANYEPGTIEEFTEANRSELRAQLRSILESVQLTDRQEEVVFPDVTF